MKQFTIILFFLSFVLAGSSQSQALSNKQINCNLNFVSNDNSSNQNALFLQDDYFDIQDSNDYGSFDSGFILPDSHNYSQHSEIEIVADVLPPLQLNQVGELLLDLPPPSLSI